MHSFHKKPIPPVPLEDWMYPAIFSSIALLVILGGIVAGLTIGLMSIDKTNLSIIMRSGDEKSKRYARSLIPIIENQHLLLVCLLLTNTIVNETLPVLFHSVHLDGYQAVLVSTALIVVFGEIIPQAVCARYGLAIGYFFAYPVRFLMFILFPIAYPIAKLLDLVLGKKHGVVYKRQELKELVDLHAGILNVDEVGIVKAVLDLRDKTVLNVMTPIDLVVMLPLSSKLDKQTINSILKAGHSRIPIYKNDRQNVIGVVLVKQLLLQDPENNVPLGNIKIRGLPRIKPQTPLFEILHVFQEGSSHMALVVEEVQEHEIGNLPSNGMFGKSPLFPFSGSDAIPYRILGIVTLEDIIEEILGSEIVDETDVYSDVVSRTRVTSSRRFMSPKISVNRAMDETEALIAEQRIADETTALLNKGRVTLTSVVVEDVKNEKRRFKESGLVEAAKLAKAIADNQFQSSDKLIDLEEEEFKLDK